MSKSQGFRIESKFALESDWLPKSVFTVIYPDSSTAVATAIEGVEDPQEQEVCVVDISTGKVVWRSTEEDYE